MRKERKPDDIDWFQGSWEGNALISLQDNWKLSFIEKLQWMEQIQELSEQFEKNRNRQLLSALEQWIDK